jgi:hypothetical protein
MAILTPLVPSATGTTYTTSAASAGGDKVSPVNCSVIVTNGSASSITLTVDVPGNDQFGLARPDIAITIAAGTSKLVGPFPLSIANPADGYVNLSYSAVTSVTIAAIASF